MSQRRLLNLLRVEVERARHGDRRRLCRLVRDNPNAILSTHVAYNLGRDKYLYVMRACGLDARAAERFARARATAAASMQPARSLVTVAGWFDATI